MAFFLPLIAGVTGLIFGKSSGGGGIELFTSKKSTQTTDARQTTTSSIYSPTINRTTDIQYNIASGYGSSISTKKEQAISQTPNVSPIVSPILTATPLTTQGGGTQTGDGAFDFTGIALIGAVGIGAYLLLSKKKK